MPTGQEAAELCYKLDKAFPGFVFYYSHDLTHITIIAYPTNTHMPALEQAFIDDVDLLVTKFAMVCSGTDNA